MHSYTDLEKQYASKEQKKNGNHCEKLIIFIKAEKLINFHLMNSVIQYFG